MNTNQPEQLITLNLIGVECPDFGLSLRHFFRTAQAGALVLVQSTAHNATRDIFALCEFGGNTLMGSRTNDSGVSEFVVKKAH